MYIDIEDFMKGAKERWIDYFSHSGGITDNDFKQLKQSFT